MVDWCFSAKDIPVEEFVEWVFLMPGAPRSPMENASHFHHLCKKQHERTVHDGLFAIAPCAVVSWYPYRRDENVLWLHYEDLKQNLGECVRLIAEFLQIGTGDGELQKLVARQVISHSLPLSVRPLLCVSPGKLRLHETALDQIRRTSLEKCA